MTVERVLAFLRARGGSETGRTAVATMVAESGCSSTSVRYAIQQALDEGRVGLGDGLKPVVRT